MPHYFTKTLLIISAIACLLGSSSDLYAQANTWTQKANVGGTARERAVGFAIGTKGYIGTGYDGGYRKDFWEYDQGTNVWTQKADFGGTARLWAKGFAIGTKGYIGTGYDGAYKKDFWEYDPGTNIWTQKVDFGGSARAEAVGFTIGSKGYIGTGFNGGPYKKDFWEYDPGTNTWTQKADFGGTERYFAIGFGIGTKGYMGTGQDAVVGFTKDFWEYDPGTNTWTQKADFGGTVRDQATGFAIGTKGYVGTGYDGPSLRKDFWEYDPGTNVWTQKADFGGTARRNSSGFVIGTKGYIGSGWDGSGVGGGFKTDFWEYTPAGTLPLKFLSFTAQQCNKNEVGLSWKTTNEQNVSHFVMERSEDGKVFRSIGNKTADNRQANAYTATDDVSPLSKNTKVFYRIRQIDADGKFTYSEVRTILLSDKTSIGIYPTPAKNSIHITGWSNVKQIKLYDVSGRQLNEWQAATPEINITNLLKGTYILKVELKNGEILQEKIIKQ